LSDVFDIDGYVKIEKGVVAIDSSNLPQLNKKAVITLKNVGYKSIPKIYYNEGFTINENEIITECDFCNLISYDDFPTNNGEVIFEVSHFSSFKVGESGEEYDLSYFEDLDKCEEGIKGNLVVEIKEPDNGDDFKFGEKIEIEIVVDNNNEDDKDVIVEAILYNKDKDDGEEDVKSDEEEIEGKDDLSFDLEMNIPDDYDKSDDYILYVKAYEDGEEEIQCNYDIIDLDLERESHDVVINEIEIMPKEINCGGSVQVNVKVENIGTKDEDDVYIRLENPELGIDLESSKFELDDYDGKNEKITKRFSLVIPENIKAKDYSLEGTVEFDDGSNSKLGILKIKDCEKVVEKEVLSVIGNTDIIKDVANIHLIIRNSMEDDILASVKVTNIGGWAENIIPQSISLHPGENNIYLHTDIKEEKKGKYTSIIEIIPKEGKIVKTNLVFDIKEKKVVVEEENIFDALIRWFEGIL